MKNNGLFEYRKIDPFLKAFEIQLFAKVLYMVMSLCFPLKFSICDICHMFSAILKDLHYTKFIHILSKFYPVRSFDYRWNYNLTLFLYKRNIYFMLENLILFRFWATLLWTSIQKYNKVVSTLTQLLFLTKWQRSNNIESSTLNRRNSFNYVSMLLCQSWNNVDKHTSAQLSFSTKFQRRNKIGSLTLNRRNSRDVVSTLFQRCFTNVETTSMSICWFNFQFQPNTNVEETLMNVDDQRCFNVDSALICLLGWDRPHVIGCLDSKDIRIKCLKLRGTLYHNYNGFISAALLAIGDTNYYFTLFHLGQCGSYNDSGVLASSQIGEIFENELLHEPEDIPYYLLGDEILALKKWLMRPNG